MSLRAKLVVAFLVLSVVPLTVIVLYNYFSSLQTLRTVALAEVTELTAEINGRVDSIREDVDRGIERLSASQFRERVTAGEAETAGEEGFLAGVDSALGAAAPFVEALEFVPIAPLAADAPQPARPEAESEIAGAEPVAPVPQTPAAAAPVAPIRSVVIALGDITEALPEDSEISEEWMASDEGQEALEQIRVHTEVISQEIAQQMSDLKLDELVAHAREQELSRARITAEEESLQGLENEHQEEAHRRQVLLVEPVESGEYRFEWKSDLLEQQEVELLERRAERSRRILGREFDSSVEAGGQLIGRLRAEVSADRVLDQVLQQADREQGEIPFAIDDEGRLYVSHEEDRAILEQLPIAPDAEVFDDEEEQPEDWVIVRVKDESSDLIFGIARPIGKSLRELRQTAGRNFAVGLGVVAVALLGIAPLSRRITRDLHTLTDGAARLATGDLRVRVPVRSGDEVGELATTFNQMAEDLERHQARLLEEERLRREQELERRLLEAENSRRGRELEDARQFQLSLLPEKVPQHPQLEIGACMRTATEVGGDYYDFSTPEDGSLVTVVGDATGHGARAGTMVTVIKSLFSAEIDGATLSGFLDNASRTIRRMQLGRMAMALTLARFREGVLDIAAAGMPPVLVHRQATDTVEELSFEGVPLGTLSDFSYRERSIDVAPGDMVLLMSDGFPELANEGGEPLGYDAVHDLFARSAGESPDELIARLFEAADAWAGDAAHSDDITFVAIRVKA